MTAVLALWLSAQDASPTPEQMQTWVQDLGSEDFATRERADKALRAAGRAALPYLDKAKESEDLEIRERAASIARSIETPSSASRPQEERPRMPRRPSSEFRLGSGAQIWVQAHGDDPYELKMGEEGIELTREGKSYKAATAEEFRKLYPDLYEKYVKPNANGVRVRIPSIRIEPRKPDPPQEPEDPFGDWTREMEDLRKMLDELHKAMRSQDEDLEKWLEGWMNRFDEQRKDLEKTRKRYAEQFRRKFEDEKPRIESESVSGGRLGLLFDVVDESARAANKLEEGEGVVIVKVIDNTIASRLGFKPADILTRVGEVRISNALQARTELWKAMESEQVSAEVVRESARRTLTARSAALKD
jgi:hypothetical protein